MTKAIRLNHHEFADFYGHLCDVIEREILKIPDSDPFSHTSKEARALSMKLVDRLAAEGYLEYR